MVLSTNDGYSHIICVSSSHSRWAIGTWWTPRCRRRRVQWPAWSSLSHTRGRSPVSGRWGGAAWTQRASLRWQRWERTPALLFISSVLSHPNNRISIECSAVSRFNLISTSQSCLHNYTLWGNFVQRKFMKCVWMYSLFGLCECNAMYMYTGAVYRRTLHAHTHTQSCTTNLVGAHNSVPSKILFFRNP